MFTYYIIFSCSFFHQSPKIPEGKYKHLILGKLGYELEKGMVPDKKLLFSLMSKVGKNNGLYDKKGKGLIEGEENDRQKNIRILEHADFLRLDGLKILATGLCKSPEVSNKQLGKRLQNEIGRI